MLEQVLIWIFWTSVALGFYVYFIYPAILAILAVLFGRRIRARVLETDEDWPEVALMIPCFDEEKEIARKLENVARLDYPRGKLRTVVMSDGSRDATARLAREFATAHPEADITVLDFPENRGKSASLFRGISWLKENRPGVEILAFTDANAVWARDALKQIVAPFSDPTVGSASGLLRYVNPEGAAAGDMEELYWKYEVLLKRLSSRLGSLPGAIGSIFALRLEAYRPLSEARGDDFELPVQAVIDGYRSILVEDADSRESPSTDFMTEYRRKLRITGQMIPSAVMLFWRALTRGRGMIAFQLLSHKLLRYLVPLYLLLVLLSSILLWNASVIYQAALLVQAVFYLLAALGFAVERAGTSPPKLLQIPLYFTMVNIASLVSMIRGIAGRPVRWERNR